MGLSGCLLGEAALGVGEGQQGSGAGGGGDGPGQRLQPSVSREFRVGNPSQCLSRGLVREQG